MQTTIRQSKSCLQVLVAQVDEQLFDGVFLERLEAGDIQDAEIPETATEEVLHRRSTAKSNDTD